MGTTSERRRAHDAVRRAVKNGTLVRQPCEVCGGVAEGHHENYAKPLEVRWLCRLHHRRVHTPESHVDLAPLLEAAAARQAAEVSLRAITEEMRAEVKMLYKAGFAKIEIAKAAGISRMTLDAWLREEDSR